MVTVFEHFVHLEYSDSYILVTSMVIPELRCITTVYATHRGAAFETVLAFNYHSFILTVAIIGVGI